MLSGWIVTTRIPLFLFFRGSSWTLRADQRLTFSPTRKKISRMTEKPDPDMLAFLGKVRQIERLISAHISKHAGLYLPFGFIFALQPSDTLTKDLSLAGPTMLKYRQAVDAVMQKFVGYHVEISCKCNRGGTCTWYITLRNSA